MGQRAEFAVSAWTLLVHRQGTGNRAAFVRNADIDLQLPVNTTGSAVKPTKQRGGPLNPVRPSTLFILPTWVGRLPGKRVQSSGKCWTTALSAVFKCYSDSL